MERGAWAAVLLLGLAPATAACSPGRVAAGPLPEAAEHEVVVRTRLAGPRVYYFEGALAHVRLEPVDPAVEGQLPQVWGPDEVGERARWRDVPEGEWRLVGSTRVCDGNCGDLSGPVDACTHDLDLTADTTVVVTYLWGEPCRITVS